MATHEWLTIVFINPDGSITGILGAWDEAEAFIEFDDYYLPFEWS